MIVLPWPSRELHPNARVHHMVRAKAAKQARADAFLLTKAAGVTADQFPDGRLHLWIDFIPPDKRHRDDDGMLSAFKAYRDGIADAMGLNDRRFVSHPWIREDKTVKGGAVEVRITASPLTADSA